MERTKGKPKPLKEKTKENQRKKTVCERVITVEGKIDRRKAEGEKRKNQRKNTAEGKKEKNQRKTVGKKTKRKH
jgi:hypothetical protein